MPPRDGFQFRGFTSPNFTQIPDELIDILMPELSEAELKVLLYVCRRTFGFRKPSDAISVTQMERGIITQDGKTLDYGTGLSRTSIRKGAAGLVEKGILTVSKARNESGEFETNVYSLRFAEVGQNLTNPRSESDPLVGQNLTTQQTEFQQTESQETEIEKSKEERKVFWNEHRSTIQDYVSDVAREFNDQASLKASTTRVMRLFEASGLELDEFISAMTEARRRTQEQSASIRSSDTGGIWPKKRKMPYFLAVLSDLLTSSQADSFVAD